MKSPHQGQKVRSPHMAGSLLTKKREEEIGEIRLRIHLMPGELTSGIARRCQPIVGFGSILLC